MQFQSRKILFPLFASIIIVSFILQHAWWCEDAFLTFRSLDNFVNGYGLRWNVDERVQVFSNPLWLLIHIPLYYVHRDIFTTMLAISIVISALTVFVLASSLGRDRLLVVVSALLPLIFSNAFLDWSSSGMENPLTHLLLVLFFIAFLGSSTCSLAYFVFIFSLSLVNRIDSAIFMLPALMFMFFKKKGWGSPCSLVAAGAPAILWFSFSLFYFGFLFPNSRYAKLGAGLPLTAYLKLGLPYFHDLVRDHFFTAFVMVCALAIGLRCIFQYWRRRDAFYLRLSLTSLGLFAFILYILCMGGDCYSGRFWSAPFCLSVIVLSMWLHAVIPQKSRKTWIGALAAVFLCMKGVDGLIANDEAIGPANIASPEDMFKLKNNIGTMQFFQHPWPQKGLQLRKASEREPGKRTIDTCGACGVIPFYTGPSYIFVDFFAVADPLLARMPANAGKFESSHFGRLVPLGYLRARETGQLDEMDEPLRSYYQKLHLVISGNLLSLKRAKAILSLNILKSPSDR